MRTSGLPGLLAAASLLAGTSTRLHAVVQCPDGTPPPCARAAPVPLRRTAPPLDDRTWIVLPFENVARVADIEWLRDASVNLLYLDMSRWRDIRVIDDERVADFMREVPETRAAGALGLATGIAVARRAGAGKLVMGDLLKVGSRTAVVAKVYDVRTGQRLRSVREEALSADSLMAVFGRLARGILNVAPPAGESPGTIGTTSLEAYRAYVAGVASLNRVDLDSAAARFGRAAELDSNFALAHYKLSVVYGWISPTDRRRVTHAERANRLSTGLPPRERALILGQQQTSQSHWGEACLTYGGLLRNDSTDVEAWYNLGECNFHDQFIATLAGDSTRSAFRGSWNLAMRAFLRALELDPTYHLAYEHLPDILLADQRPGCRGRDVLSSACPPTDQFIAILLRDGDSLLTQPHPAGASAALTRQSDEAVRQRVWATNVQQNRIHAQAWVNAGPDEARAHLALGRALLRAGQLPEAAREYALAGPLAGSVSEGRSLLDRLEFAFKLDSLTLAARLVDSLATRHEPRPNDMATFAPMVLGRWQHVAFLFGAGFQVPPIIKDFFTAAMRAMQGAPPENLVALELGVDSLLAAQGMPAPQRRAARTMFQMVSAPWTLNLLRPDPLRDADTAQAELRVRVVVFALRGDTAQLRAALARLDSQLAASPRELPTATGFQWSAEGHLFLGDSATALARLREFEARLPYLNPAAAYLSSFGNLTVALQTWGRTFLRLADLADAAGDRATAVRNYRRVAALWEGADPAFRPAVRRAREALTRHGG